VEFFFEVADHEVAPLGRQPAREQREQETRRVASHLVSSRRSRPTVIDVNAW
jgi:hypothetical protein